MNTRKPVTLALPEVGAYYVEPSEGKKQKIFRVYGPFQTELDAFRVAFFMHSRVKLYASKTEDFASVVRRDVTFHEPGEMRYLFRDSGWHEMGYKRAKLLSAQRVPVHVSWKAETHDRELAEHHVLNNARAADVISSTEKRRLYEEWRQVMVAKGLLTHS
jgi:hypothetical protein